MITITIYKKPDNQYKGFQILGHADSVEEGADLVCCSVSQCGTAHFNMS